MHYPQLNINIRRRLDDQSARSFSIDDVGEVINEAAHFLQGEIGMLQNRTSLSMVKDQREYTLASNVQKVLEVEYAQPNWYQTLTGRNVKRFRMESRSGWRATLPQIYCHLETENKLIFHPIPIANALTATLNGNMGTTDSTITVLSTASFPVEGRLIIESEVVQYTNTTATTFTGVTRGLEGTTAATHTGALTITLRDVYIFGQRLWQDREMYRYYNTGTATATNGSAAVTGSGTAWLTNASVGDYFGVSADGTTTDALIWYKISAIVSDTSITLASNFTLATASGSNYVIGSPNPFPSYCDPFFIAFGVSTCLKKANQFDKARMEWAAVERWLATTRANENKNDTMLVSQSLRARPVGRRMPTWIGDQYII